MDSVQEELLKKFGPNHICIDGTYKTNAYDFHIITLMTLDNLNEGFPCAFLITNREDGDILKIFYSKIKERVGVISTRVFMSDITNIYFDAWVLINNVPKFRLYCAWHILRAWKKNLQKVKKEKQQELYDSLRTLLQETDMNTFTTTFEALIHNFTHDKDLAEFGAYFMKYYSDNVPYWAYCHRVNAGINTNMHIERFHKTLKYSYLNAKNNKRLDKTIDALMKLLEDKKHDRLIALHKGKLTSKLKTIRNRHDASKNLQTTNIVASENSWMVPSASKNRNDISYTINKVLDTCSCKLICNECKSCIHKYQCTCLDYSIRSNMCKHIHLICRYVSSEINMENYNDSENTNNNEKQILIEDLFKKQARSSFMNKKRKLIEERIDLMTNLSTPEEIRLLEKDNITFKAKLDAMRNKYKEKLIARNKSSANKKITQQRFLSTKKVNKRHSQKNVYI
jgi:hypothetical protein